MDQNESKAVPDEIVIINYNVNADMSDLLKGKSILH